MRPATRCRDKGVWAKASVKYGALVKKIKVYKIKNQKSEGQSVVTRETSQGSTPAVGRQGAVTAGRISASASKQKPNSG